MKLSEYLKSSGLTQKEFADKIGVSVMSVSLWLHHGRIPRAAALERIRAETGGQVTPADFYPSAEPQPERAA